MSKHSTLTWPDRFALINEYKPSDDVICSTFNLSDDELSMARTLHAAGSFGGPNTLFDAVKYGDPFTASAASASAPQTSRPSGVKKAKSGATVHARPTVSADGLPQTATKSIKLPQKRGRKGDKIQTALLAVPETPIAVDDFRKQHPVSLAVLRQSRRFISKMDVATRTKIGVVNVRQDKDTKVLMIWRETPSSN